MMVLRDLSAAAVLGMGHLFAGLAAWCAGAGRWIKRRGRASNTGGPSCV